MSIQIFNNDSLLNIFYHCRPIPLHEDEDNNSISWRKWSCSSEHWWYNLAQVCRKWWFLVLASASRLNLCLVCTFGMPVAEMLTNPPPLPLAINYFDEICKLTTEDEGGILFALQCHCWIRCVRLCIPVSILQKVILAIDGEFPILECLIIKSLAGDKSMTLPETFQAPLLRCLILRNISQTPGLFCHNPAPPTAQVQSMERLSLWARCSGPQLWRYASFFYIFIGLWVNAVHEQQVSEVIYPHSWQWFTPQYIWSVSASSSWQ